MFAKPAPWVHSKNIQTLFVLYLLSNILLLCNINGIYWDDWVLYNQPFSELQDMMNQLTGNAHVFEYIHRTFSSIGNEVFSFRLATVLLYFLSGLFLYFILLNIKPIPRQSVFYITLLFLILPVNSARIALCDFQYGLFLCLFFMAFWVLTQAIKRPRNLILRATVLVLFYFSFYVSSLLVFYAIVLLYLLYQTHQRPNQSRLASTLHLFSKYPDFVVLPLLFYGIKSHYFIPYGLYDHYNALSTNPFLIPLELLRSVRYAFFEPLGQAVFISLRFWYLLTVLTLLIAVYLRDRTPFLTDIPIKTLMAAGILFFIIAVFPYIVVGKMPVLSSFGSRHMLLIPLGIALILYTTILAIEQKRKNLGHALLLILIASCILKNMHDQTQYLKDWMYQVALEEHFKTNPEIKQNRTFILNSHITLANHREMDFYENNGRLRKVFGDDQRFMVGSLDLIQTYANFKQYKRYNFSTWTPSQPLTVTVQTAVHHDLTFKPFLNMLALMLTNETEFRQKAKTLIKMDVA